MTRIAVAAPIRPSAQSGNDVTAARWAAHLNHSDHAATVVPVTEDEAEPTSEAMDVLDDAEILIALHGRRSAPTVRWWQRRHANRVVIVGLAGTDLYVDMPGDAATMSNVAAADALIVLQSAAVERLHAFDPSWVAKTHLIHQSVTGPLPPRRPPFDEFRVVVLAHLRSIKDPLLAARSAALLPPSSRVAVHHGGRAMDDNWLLQASAESASNSRYVWHGELNGEAALELLASAHVLACTSIAEGGANVVSEAIAMGVPVVGTRMDGNVGLLGADHPGLFPVGDHLAFATMLDWLELSPTALADLERRSIERQYLTDPATEQAALDTLIRSLTH